MSKTEKIQSFLNALLNLEKKKVTDDQGVETIFENFTYQELMDLVQSHQIIDHQIIGKLRELLVAHLAAGVAKLSAQGGIGNGVELKLNTEQLRELIDLCKSTVELQMLLETHVG